MKIGPASPAERSGIRNLLLKNGLPLEGYPNDCRVVLALRDGEKLAGGAALEVHGPYGLLRSLVVEASSRGSGGGAGLVEAILCEADRFDLRQVYLLTETALDFFPRFGFVPVDRSAVPAALRESAEFKGACPDSAQAMRRSPQAQGLDPD